MLFMTVYSFPTQNRDAAIARFKQTGAAPPPGVKMRGRWHDVGGGRGFTLAEADDPQALMKWVLKWSDLLSFKVTPVLPVLDDEQFTKALGS